MDDWRNWLEYIKHLDLDSIQWTLESYSQWGPFPGILLPMIESFLPFLPLILIIAANANIYGLGFGFLFSWIGVTTGAVCVFWISRKLGRNVKGRMEKRFPKSQRFLIGWKKEDLRRCFCSLAFHSHRRSLLPSSQV